MGPIIDKTKDSSTPLVYISTYIDTPVWTDEPAPMSFKDVKGLFHEFGHMLQFLLMDVEFGSLSGLHAIDVDANEFVSQVSLFFTKFEFSFVFMNLQTCKYLYIYIYFFSFQVYGILVV